MRWLHCVERRAGAHVHRAFAVVGHRHQRPRTERAHDHLHGARSRTEAQARWHRVSGAQRLRAGAWTTHSHPSCPRRPATARSERLHPRPPARATSAMWKLRKPRLVHAGRGQAVRAARRGGGVYCALLHRNSGCTRNVRWARTRRDTRLLITRPPSSANSLACTPHHVSPYGSARAHDGQRQWVSAAPAAATLPVVRSTAPRPPPRPSVRSGLAAPEGGTRGTSCRSSTRQRLCAMHRGRIRGGGARG